MDLEALRKSNRIFFECRSGSFAYGTNTQKSDVDIRGLFTQPFSELISLNGTVAQVSDERNDIVFYSLRRFLELACDANPNILEILYMPEDCILKSSAAFETLKAQRNMFITQKCIQTHQAYALAQIKKARGRNKWINNPQPRERPSIDKFCYFIDRQDKAPVMPFRPVNWHNCQLLDQKKLRCSSVEHCPGLYRLYRSDEAGDIFINENIHCSSIPKEEESSHNIGLLYFNANAYKRALTDHKNYWGWVKNRNPERWVQQEQGELDYDSKNMQHTMRLLLTAEGILNKGEITVRFSGEKLKLLSDIRLGLYSYDELIEMAEDLSTQIEHNLQSSHLPKEASKQETDKLLVELSQP